MILKKTHSPITDFHQNASNFLQICFTCPSAIYPKLSSIEIVGTLHYFQKILKRSSLMIDDFNYDILYFLLFAYPRINFQEYNW